MSQQLPPPPKKADERFDNWMFRLWKKAFGALNFDDIGVTAPITITTSGTGTLNIGHGTSGVVTGTYGGALGVPRVIVDTYGHITAGTSFPLQATAPVLIGSNAGTFTWGHSTSGAVTGTYGSQSSIPILAINTWGHITLATSSAIAASGTSVTGADLTVSSPLTGTATNALLREGTIGHGTSGVTSGTYGGASIIPQVVVNTWGHITAVNTFGITLGGNLVTNVQNGAYTLGTGDVNNLVYREGTATGVTTWTVPSTLGTGALVSGINDGTGNLTLTAVGTMVFAGTGATGNRTVPQYGMFSVVSVGTSRWFVSGAGVS